MNRETPESFLARWSRRKREAERGRTEAPAAEAKAATTSPAEARDAEMPALDPADLPDPETLGPDADFRVYLREGVPEELKRRALRRLWRCNPVIRSVDMLDDYCEDFTDAATVVAGLRTVYEAGRGFWRKLEEAEVAVGDRDGAGAPRSPEGDGQETAEAASRPAASERGAENSSEKV